MIFLTGGIPDVPVPRRLALDTETDQDFDGETKNRMVQVMSVEGTSEDDAIVFHGWDSLPRFLSWLDTTHQRLIDVHLFNANFEFSYFLPFLLRDYQFTNEKIPKKTNERKPHSWTVLQDMVKVYRFEIVNSNGSLIRFTDDSLRFGGFVSMAKTAEAIRRKHPELFINIQNEKAKLETDYHRGWLNLNDKNFQDSLAYSVRDIYSQSRIAKYTTLNKMTESMTSTSHGLKDVISRVYENCSYAENDYFFFNKKLFAQHFPPLDEEMQDIAEHSMSGGFVYGLTGDHKGIFTHIDYSSAYPYEYAYGRLPYGKCRYRGNDIETVEKLVSRGGICYFIVEFDFKLKKGYLPLINGHEINERVSRLSVKQIEGHFAKRLIPRLYFDELKHHYSISNMIIHEYWVFNGETGYLRNAIEYYYTHKNELKHEGKGKSIDYMLDKLMMNGGAHGKFIQKTHKRKADYSTGEKVYREEYSPPKYLFMVGYTAMYSARTRLARDARKLIEHGYHIFMCDTDSIVSDCPSSELIKILGSKKFMSPTSTKMEDNLGRFEIEEFEGQTEFDRFKCWGLKMYLEIKENKSLFDLIQHCESETPRKFAFKGAKHPDPEILMNAPTDGTVFTMEALQSHAGKHGKVIEKITKKFRAFSMFESEYPWWDDSPEPWEIEENTLNDDNNQ